MKMNLNRDAMKRMLLLIFYTVVLLGLALRFERVLDFFGWIFRLLFPFFMGGAIAFILNVPMRCIERSLPGGGPDQKGRRGRWRRPFSLIAALVFVLLILAVVLFVVAPQLTQTLLTLGMVIPRFLRNIQSMLEETFTAYPEILSYVQSFDFQMDWRQTFERLAGFVTTGAGTVLSSTMSAAVSIASGLTTFSIAFIFAIYILLQKETLIRQIRKLLSAYLPEPAVTGILRVARLTEQSFSRFLTGQCVEAVILGTMFFVTLSLFRFPYALLIGVLIAFTALIPIFGAWIGCAIGIFLMLMVSPIQALWFVVIFFVLQQIEGNLIYPHVVGNSVGLPSIWVLAAVSIGGSMLGIIGMLVFIPLCSVFYTLLREDVNRQLKKRAEAKEPEQPKRAGAEESEDGEKQNREKAEEL